MADAAAVSRALEPVPLADEVRMQLGSMFFGQIYEPESRRDIWVGSDGDVLGVVVVAGISAGDAKKVRDEFGKESHILDAETVAACIARALKRDVSIAS